MKRLCIYHGSQFKNTEKLQQINAPDFFPPLRSEKKRVISVLYRGKMNKIIMTISLIGFLCLSPFCYAQENIEQADFIKKFSPKLKIECVIEKSKEYAKNQEINLNEYFIEEIKYDWQKNEWYIFFMGRVPNPGNNFTIFIDNKTEEIRLKPGL